MDSCCCYLFVHSFDFRELLLLSKKRWSYHLYEAALAHIFDQEALIDHDTVDAWQKLRHKVTSLEYSLVRGTPIIPLAYMCH